ncbi:MAG: hypothetical protein AB7J32_23360, partial [Pseudonocardia sp.]
MQFQTLPVSARSRLAADEGVAVAARSADQASAQCAERQERSPTSWSAEQVAEGLALRRHAREAPARAG